MQIKQTLSLNNIHDGYSFPLRLFATPDDKVKYMTASAMYKNQQFHAI